MLRAIAIYEEDKTTDAKKLKRVRSVPEEEKSVFNTNIPLFRAADAVFASVDNILLHSDYYQSMKSGLSYRLKPRLGETNYIYQPPNKTYVIAIFSKQPLSAVEKTHLFENIGHVYRNPKVGVTLGKIFENPQGYTGRDILVDRIQEEIDITIKKMHENIDIAKNRGENIENLAEKAVTIGDHALTFKDRSKKLNSYCCSY